MENEETHTVMDIFFFFLFIHHYADRGQAWYCLFSPLNQLYDICIFS